MKMWKCSVCNFVHEGEEAPEKCPKCGAPQDKFVALDENAVNLVERSRHTNMLHLQLAAALAEVQKIAEAGIADQLDPPCVTLFTRARDSAALLTQMIKAELEGHMKKGKWG